MEDGNHENGNGKQPMKPPAENNNGGPRQPPPSQPPQQCPRCNSFNTKFCYYNNYSLSQPRYFCKNCRRYWTQGGTLRNVPVGGGCRKGAKRLVKGSTSGTLPSCSFLGESSRSQEHLLPPPPPLPALAPPHMRGFSSMSSLPFANSLYSTAGGILPSFGAMQNLNRPLINGVGSIGGGGSSSTNLSVLQGLMGSQNMNSRPPQVQQQQQLYQSSDPVHQMMAQPNRPLVSWTRGFINNPNSGSSNSTTTNVSWAQNMVLQPNITTSGSGLAGTPAMNNPNQWPDDDHLSGYDPPPPSS